MHARAKRPSSIVPNASYANQMEGLNVGPTPNETRKGVAQVQKTEGSPLRSYVFVTTEPGTTRAVVHGISALEFPGCRILTVEQVIGGCDIIAKMETPDLDRLARAITHGIREVPGALDVVASWCCDGLGGAQREPSSRFGTNDVVSVTGN